MVEGNGAAQSIFSQGFKYTFAVLAPGTKYLQGILEMAQTLKPKPKTVAIATANDAFSVEVGGGAAAYATAHGMTVIYNNKVSRQHDRRLRCRQRDQSREPDIILNGGHLDEALLLQRTFKEQNVNAKIFGTRSDRIRRTSARHSAKTRTGSSAARSGRRRRSIRARGFISDSKVYAAEFNKKYGHVPDYHNAESTAACLAFSTRSRKPVRSIRSRCAMRCRRSTS